MATVDAVGATVDDPEVELRRRLRSRVGPAVMVDDPVYGTPESTPPPPAPTVQVDAPYTRPPLAVPPPKGTLGIALPAPPVFNTGTTTTRVGDDDGGGTTPTTPTTPTSPTTPTPTPPVTPPGMTYDSTLPDGRMLFKDQYGQLFTMKPGSPTGYEIYTPPTPTPTTTTTDTTTTTPPEDWSKGDWDAARVARYFASRGVTPNPSSAAYWAQKWQEFGKNDPAYFLRRLAAADEFGGGGGAGGGGGGGVPGASTGQTEFQNALRAIIMARLAQAQRPVDQNDPYIREPMVAAETEAGRQTQAERTALAERLAATGDTSRSLEMGIAQSAERNAVGLGSLRAKLIADEYNKRRQELADLMQMALASNDAQAAREIQAAAIALQQARWEAETNAGMGA